MTDLFDKIKTWVLANKVIAGIIGAVLLFIAYKKFFRRRRVTHHRRSRTLPRSVGTHRRRSANSIIKSGVHRGKKAWQVKGSEAARRHMASIRRRKRSLI
jgi:hypothetical protein